MQWLTVKEATTRFVVPESTLRYNSKKNRIRTESRAEDGRLLVYEPDCARKWFLRPEAAADDAIVQYVEQFEAKFPGGTDNGESLKEQYELSLPEADRQSYAAPIRRPVDVVDIHPIKKFLIDSLANTAGTVAGGAILAGAGVAAAMFLNKGRDKDGEEDVGGGEVRQCEGTIMKLTEKGFGFIEKDVGGDLFFHHSSLEGVPYEELREGQRVRYEEGEGSKGPAAERVRVIE